MPANVISGRFAAKGTTAATELRVLAIIPGQKHESTFVFARREIAALAKAGIEVRAFFLSSRTSPVAVFRLARELRREVRSFRPHVIHAHYGTVTSFLCSVLSDVPLVITFRGSDLNGDPEVGAMRNSIGHLFSQLSCLRAERMICVARRLHEKLWWRRERAVIIPNGIDLNLFCPKSKEEERARLGWDRELSTVLFVGGERPRTKGLDLAREAVDQAGQVIGPIRFVVLEGRVPYEMMPCYLNAADCLALASKYEGSPSIIREAMACNLPVVATDVGDVAERLEGVYPSRVVGNRNPFDFGEALAEVLSCKRRSNGRERVMVCDEPRVAEAILAIYEAALGRPVSRLQAAA